MKILILVPTLASYPFLRDMCFELASAGHTIHLAASWSALGRFQSDGNVLNFHQINFPRGMNPIGHFKAMWQLNKLVKKIEPSIIDVHFSAAAFTAALAHRENWPPTIATVQGLRFPLASGLQKFILEFAECWSAKRLEAMVVLTDDDMAALRKAGVANGYKQVAYGFGCDLNKFNKNTYTEEENKKIKNDLDIGEFEIVFSFIGRFVQFKGFHLVVRAFLEASDQCMEIKLLLCGDFDDYHASGLTEAEISELKAHQKVIFTGWTDDVRKFLSITDVIVFPSEREGVPVILMEGLSMGIPVITCDSRGCREVMNKGENGIVLENRNSEELAAAIVRMARDEYLRNAYSSAAIDFRENFDQQKFSKEHIELLETYGKPAL